MITLASIFIRNLHLAVILDIEVQVDTAGAFTVRVDVEMDPVILLPVLATHVKAGHRGPPAKAPSGQLADKSGCN